MRDDEEKSICFIGMSTANMADLNSLEKLTKEYRRHMGREAFESFFN